MTLANSDTSNSGPKSHLDAISTRWAQVGDPIQFVMRYAPAIRKYLAAILGNSADVDDVCQDFLLRSLSHHFAAASPDQGKFRKYLKSAVRNAALMHLRGQRRRQNISLADLEEAADPHLEPLSFSALSLDPGEDAEWSQSWQQCLLDRAWRALHGCLRKETEGNILYTALRITADHPDEDSKQLAARVSEKLGRPVKPEALRQQLSRARRLFAELIVREISQSLEVKSADSVEQELIDIGLLPYVRKLLPEGWRDVLDGAGSA